MFSRSHWSAVCRRFTGHMESHTLSPVPGSELSLSVSGLFPKFVAFISHIHLAKSPENMFGNQTWKVTCSRQTNQIFFSLPVQPNSNSSRLPDGVELNSGQKPVGVKRKHLFLWSSFHTACRRSLFRLAFLWVRHRAVMGGPNDSASVPPPDVVINPGWGRRGACVCEGMPTWWDRSVKLCMRPTTVGELNL